MIAGLEARHSIADRADDTGALMTEHFRKFSLIIGVTPVQVGCAHAAGNDLDQQFVGSRIAEIDLFNGERARTLVHHSSRDLHRGA